MSASAEHETVSQQARSREGLSDGPRRIWIAWQWLGLSGAVSGTNGLAWRTLLGGYGVTMLGAAAVDTLHVITTYHEEPWYSLSGSIISEGSSWLTFILFLWVIWSGYRIAPPWVRPRWRLLVHAPAVLVFSLVHVSGFIGLRKLIYLAAGADYRFGTFLVHFPYELSKDVIGYALVLGTFALVERVLRQQSPALAPEPAPTFDIRDGARLTRVRLEQVLAIVSAGNYVEFVLADGRKLLMRAPLSALERELGSRGFLRTHRSCLVNTAKVSGLKPAGSGDYTVELGRITAPLSRRFPAALADLRGTDRQDGAVSLYQTPQQINLRGKTKPGA